jgi:hypothetical protein
MASTIPKPGNSTAQGQAAVNGQTSQPSQKASKPAPPRLNYAQVRPFPPFFIHVTNCRQALGKGKAPSAPPKSPTPQTPSTPAVTSPAPPQSAAPVASSPVNANQPETSSKQVEPTTAPSTVAEQTTKDPAPADRAKEQVPSRESGTPQPIQQGSQKHDSSSNSNSSLNNGIPASNDVS